MLCTALTLGYITPKRGYFVPKSGYFALKSGYFAALLVTSLLYPSESQGYPTLTLVCVGQQMLQNVSARLAKLYNLFTTTGD